MEPVRFAIAGGAGWRAQFFLRVASELPERFEVCGMVVRDPAKARDQERRWGVKTYRSLEDLLAASDPLFVVVSVPWEAAPGMLEELAGRQVPALCETPPAPDVERLVELHRLVEKGAKIQVAEQYIFQPAHAARLAIARSGKLGTVSQAQVSAAHGYHGVSLIRHLLGVSFEPVTVSAFQFASPIVAGPGRGGPPEAEKITDSTQIIAHLDFGDRLGVFDFTGDQYFSWIRSPRVLVRGERGEINDTALRYLADFRTPVETQLLRADAGHDGNLEGYYHKGFLAGDEWVYVNPFAPARLADDEIAVAACLAGMAEYVRGGAEVYPLAQAAQDRYLDILIAEAIETKRPIKSSPQLWGKC